MVKKLEIDDARRIMQVRNSNDPIKMTFADTQGEINTFIFR